MNREYKFRAWDEELNKMTTDFCITGGNGTIERICFHEEYNKRLQDLDPSAAYAIIDFTDYYASNNYIIMQFTGLLDRNGKEIYEGDLLKWNESRVLEIQWGAVGWTLYSDLFKSFGNPDGGYCGEYHTKSYVMDSYLIGNIYENPELVTK